MKQIMRGVAERLCDISSNDMSCYGVRNVLWTFYAVLFLGLHSKACISPPLSLVTPDKEIDLEIDGRHKYDTPKLNWVSKGSTKI